MKKQSTFSVVATASLLGAAAAWAADIGTGFTYQGQLDSPPGIPVNGLSFDFRFGLCDVAVAGNQKGIFPQAVTTVKVQRGVFGATIDFCVDAVNGTARWVEVEVQCPGDADFTLLASRDDGHALRVPRSVFEKRRTIVP